LPEFEALDEDSRLLFNTVRRAGELGKSLARRTVQKWSKSDGTQVTEADLAINALIENTLRPARPTYGWLSEETPDDHARLSTDRIWIIDPIDGTSAFIRQHDEWCVAAALVERGRPIAAAVYRPMVEEFYSAIAGQGAFLDSAPLAIADSDNLGGARIAGNRKALTGLAETGIEGDHSGRLPLQLRLAYVAAGRIDGAVSFGNRNDWDLAAGDLLVIEAGGVVSNTSGARYIYNRPEAWQQGLIAAGAKRHAAIINALRTA
jgi:myo-inositol-1(or 4)-monophosphatase